MKWIEAVSRLSRDNHAFVVVTILNVRGSAPRAESSKMVVSRDDSIDSIGGGRLEHEAIRHARELLDSGAAVAERRQYILGKELMQCCGGEIELLYESFPACDFHISLHGAGHVGQAIVRILSGLPCRVRWFDGREEMLNDAMREAGSPENISPIAMQNPFDAVEQSAAGAYHLVITHSHDLDFELCEAVLGRDDIGFCGLIGSKSKARSFSARLRRKGFSDAELARLISPVGLDLGRGKLPMEVAVSIVAQIIQLRAKRQRQKTAGESSGDEQSLEIA